MIARDTGGRRRGSLRPWHLAPILPAILVVLVTVTLATAAPLVSPHSPTDQNLLYAEEPPGTVYPVGADHLGRDVLSRVIYGARVSVALAAGTALAAAAIGALVGSVAGYARGWADGAISVIVDMQLAFPPVLLAIAMVSALGPSLGNTAAVMVLTTWVVFARLIRGDVLSLREREFVTAAWVLGGSPWRVLFRHVLPQTQTALLVMLTLQLGRMIVLEATLSFLGLGVQPPEPSWGNLLADGRDYLASSWWIATVPGVAITLNVWAVNLVGDWLRDELDPRIG
ncbi:MAG: ABC transporter permease [Chloroflexota bacterium]